MYDVISKDASEKYWDTLQNNSIHGGTMCNLKIKRHNAAPLDTLRLFTLKYLIAPSAIALITSKSLFIFFQVGVQERSIYSFFYLDPY